MKADSTLLLDIGGQGCRALAVDGYGHIRFECSRHASTREHDSHVEQDPVELIDAVEAVAVQALAEMNGRSLPITQAALAVQRGSIVCWDRVDGTALSPVISWRDRRGLPGMKLLADQADEIRRRTGLRFSPYGGASKIAWCLKELSEVRLAREHGRLACGPLGSFLLARLLAEKPVRIEHTLAQRTLLWSRGQHDWDHWLLDLFEVPLEVLPRVVPSLGTHGHLARSASPVPLNLVMGDQNCIPFLDGTPDPETLYINLGTGAFLLRPVREPVDDERFQLTLLDRNHACRWALEASVHGAASAIAWLENRHGSKIEHERMNGLRERVTEPPLFINSIDGLGSPWWCPGPEVGFVQEREQHDKDARLLAVLESIAFLIRACVEAMNDSVDPPARLVLSGGLSRSETMCELIADLLEIDTCRLDTAEGTALGLWCRLHHRSLPRQHLNAVTMHGNEALNERYRRWLAHIEAGIKAR
jgi:glycerol kinase